MTSREDREIRRRRMERLIHAVPPVEKPTTQASTSGQGIEVDFRSLASQSNEVINRPLPPERDPRYTRWNGTLGFWMFGLPGIFAQAIVNGLAAPFQQRR